MKTINQLALITLLIILESCGGAKIPSNDASYYQEKYRLLANERLDSTYKSYSLLKDLTYNMQMLDLQTTSVLHHADVLDRKLVVKTTPIAEISTRYDKLFESVNSALKQVGDLEKGLSSKLKTVQHANIKNSVKSEDIDAATQRMEAQANAMAQLSGLRNLYLKVLADYKNQIETFATATEQKEQLLQLQPSTPVVQSLAEGGVITGVVRDSVSGSAVAGATVGFKQRLEDLRYFYTTTTDAQGRYESAFVRPGNYIVEVKRDGFVNTSRNEVTVATGQRSEENASLSAPIGVGQFRATVTWGAQASGRVRDVDSYLATPEGHMLSYNRTVVPGANLDRDDTDWIGPETVTITEVSRGTYVYFLNNYSERNSMTALGNSEIRVELYKGDTHVKTFSVPQGSGMNYEVFRIVNGEVRITGAFTNQNPRGSR